MSDEDWRRCLDQGRQVRNLEKQQQKQAAAVQNWDSYEFKLFPTCPPSTSVVLRGGLNYLPSSVGLGHGWYVDSYTVDLTDTDLFTTSTSFANRNYTFANAYWYAGCVLVLRYGLNPDTFGLHPSTFPDQGLTLAGTNSSSADGWFEYETAAEVEDAFIAMSMERANSNGMSIAALVLRNDGATTEPNKIQPIDRVNRGRSYFLWDVRQAWQIE